LHPAVFWLGLVAAFGYAIAALFIKEALERGCPANTINFYCNLVMALFMQGLLVFAVEPSWWQHLWKPAVCGLAFYLGQYLTFASLARCEVGVATPILGAKVIFVVLFLSLLGGSVLGFGWWVAAAMCSLGIVLVSARRGFLREAGTRSGGAMAALGASAAFGLTDALFQLWVPALGFGAFAPLMFLFVAFLSLLHILLEQKKTAAFPPKGTRVAAWTGLILLCLQSVLVATGIGLFEDAPGTNIIYGSRAVLGVVLAAAVIRFGKSPVVARDPGTSFPRKLAGSILVFAAIAIVLFK
jgi:drug/metabolite transporter (DMT)-like permease